MSLEYAILGFLSDEPSTGYDLKNRCFAGSVSTFWNADQAQIYRTLDKLSKNGSIQATRKRQAQRPDRIIFSITPQGQDALDTWLKTPDSLGSIRDSFALKVHFATKLAPSELVTLFSNQRDEHQKRLTLLESELDETNESTSATPKKYLVQSEAIKGIIAQERGALDSLNQTLVRLRSLKEGA